LRVGGDGVADRSLRTEGRAAALALDTLNQPRARIRAMPDTPTPYDIHRLRELAGELIVNIRELAQSGWTPATSSNFSRRLDDRHAAITVSGRDKGKLKEGDIMVVDFDGAAVGSDHRQADHEGQHDRDDRVPPGARRR
jgi:hypothetical protein